MRWLREMYAYGFAGGFWALVLVTIMGFTLAIGIWELRCEVKRLVDVLERTQCGCKVIERDKWSPH